MDAQYPFASRDDIWRVLDELKDIQVAQFDQAERITRLERRREEDARVKGVWGPQSPFLPSMGGSVPTETAFNSPPDAFKGFDQGQHQGMSASTVGIDGEEEPRRGASRANSVRFDESANHGYYGQASRSSTELPLRTGSGMSSHPLTERSLSHRSDGRQSSSGFSHHSMRTNSLGLDSASRLMSSSFSDSPLTPPPGLFVLGPVPSIIRCWMTENFSTESLLYAVVCSASYMSSLGTSLIAKLGLQDSVMHDCDRPYIKLPVYLPEASIRPSSRPASPDPQVPMLKVRFIVRETHPNDETIQIIIGNDVLRAHNADILFSQDKINMTDNERNRISLPLVRPEKDSVFRFLCTVPDTSHPDFNPTPHVNGHSPVGVIGQSPQSRPQSTSAPASTRVSVGDADEAHKPRLQETGHPPTGASAPSMPPPAIDTNTAPTKVEPAGVWGSWRRDPKPSSAANTSSNRRGMTVLRPGKATRAASSTSTPTSATADHGEATAHTDSAQSGVRPSSDANQSSKASAPNPIGGASAFGWLNPSSSATHATRQS